MYKINICQGKHANNVGSVRNLWTLVNSNFTMDCLSVMDTKVETLLLPPHCFINQTEKNEYIQFQLMVTDSGICVCLYHT